MAPVTGRLDVGRYPGGEDDTARALAAAFAGSRFEAEARPDIMRFKYGKLLTNLGNAVEAITGPGGHDSEIARRAREEGAASLRAAGIAAADGVTVLGQVRPIGGRDRLGGSTYQSLQRGTGTIEVDYLNGEIALLGRSHGVPTPVNELLQQVANRMARERQAPGTMTPEELLKALEE
jgi:2-dehydropantoate 2-reductase